MNFARDQTTGPGNDGGLPSESWHRSSSHSFACAFNAIVGGPRKRAVTCFPMIGRIFLCRLPNGFFEERFTFLNFRGQGLLSGSFMNRTTFRKWSVYGGAHGRYRGFSHCTEKRNSSLSCCVSLGKCFIKLNTYFTLLVECASGNLSSMSSPPGHIIRCHKMIMEKLITSAIIAIPRHQRKFYVHTL